MQDRSYWSQGLLVLAFVLLAGMLIGCQDGGGSPTAPSAPATAESARLATTGTSAIRVGAAESAGEDDDGGDDSSSDDVSDDADDNHTNDEANGTDDENEVKGLFFGIEACPTVDCVVALRVKDTLVVITNETEIVNQPAADALVSPSDLEALVAGHLGLPMKAQGLAEGDFLVASKLRILGRIRATGRVVSGSPGCDFGLLVRDATLCFVQEPGSTPPTPGAYVRVEGEVPSDFSSPFLATSIRNEEDD